jgi:KDO2-lipid IV(A) lauroyltransferase
MKEWLEFAPAWLLLKFVGILPRPVARALAVITVRVLLFLVPKLRRVAVFNLQIAFPEWSEQSRREIISNMARYLAWQAVEFARFPRYASSNIQEIIEIEGHENFLEAQRKGKGVLILTGHIGAWELSSFAHAVYGFPMHYMARPLDNALLDAFVNRYRCIGGNKPIYKNESARAVLKALGSGGVVGILAD